jgi:hypothetical protein
LQGRGQGGITKPTSVAPGLNAPAGTGYHNNSPNGK